MTDLTLDDWRALVHQLGERSPDRRALARAEIERTTNPAIVDFWEPLTAAHVAAELGRVFGPAASAHQRERSAIIAEEIAGAGPERSPTAAVAQALGLSDVSARRLIAEHKRSSGAQALGERTAVSAQ